jgi:hypothetical protein
MVGDAFNYVRLDKSVNFTESVSWAVSIAKVDLSFLATQKITRFGPGRSTWVAGLQRWNQWVD